MKAQGKLEEKLLKELQALQTREDIPRDLGSGEAKNVELEESLSMAHMYSPAAQSTDAVDGGPFEQASETVACEVAVQGSSESVVATDAFEAQNEAASSVMSLLFSDSPGMSKGRRGGKAVQAGKALGFDRIEGFDDSNSADSDSSDGETTSSGTRNQGSHDGAQARSFLYRCDCCGYAFDARSDCLKILLLLLV